ncbi:pyruvate phosphate dikinase, PEP/pyruvate binding domain [Bacteroidales bacterium 6E]|nr:pyruvate phosphate dikinase, PEP/pyruvate binding domain [Bacteroidales bacterium 6E]
MNNDPEPAVSSSILLPGMTLEANNNILNNSEPRQSGPSFTLSSIIDLVQISDLEIPITDKLVSINNWIVANCRQDLILHSRLNFGGLIIADSGYSDNGELISRNFYLPDHSAGSIEWVLRNSNNIPVTKEQVHVAIKSLDYILPFIKGILAKEQLKILTDSDNGFKNEFDGIDRAAEILGRSKSIDELMTEMCKFLPEILRYPNLAEARIRFGEKIYTSPGFTETPWVFIHPLETPDNGHGSIELFYRELNENTYQQPFLPREQTLIANLATLIAGSVSEKALKKLLIQNTERLKELRGINQTTKILESSRNIEEALQRICNMLPEAMQYPHATVVRIFYHRKLFVSPGFRETEWNLKQKFELPDRKKGVIEIYYLENFPDEFEGPFLKEELELLENIATLIAGSAIKDVFKKLNYENTERIKELKAINETSRIIDEGKTIPETLREICEILPKSWQYPKYTAARIQFEGRTYVSGEFQETPWYQTEYFVTIDNNKGSVEIFYLRKFPAEDEGPFLHEERNLLINICRLISGYLNNLKGRGIIHLKGVPEQAVHPSDAFRTSLIRNKKPLQLYFNQQAIDKYIYLEMMRYKIKHILFVSTLYDAFNLESEDSFFAKFMGEIYQYSLFSVPRITGVSTAEEALELLETTRFDLVILMAGIDRESPVQLSEKIRERFESLPIYLLVNRKSDVKYYEEVMPSLRSIDKLFVWSGDSLILFSIVKLTEDKVNVDNDTRVGLVRVILLIEDSPIYYSKYIQILFDIVFNHVKQLLPEVEKNELDKISRMRSRPKILHARNYEEAIAIFNKYRDFMLCIISDVEFEKAGRMDKEAGAKLIRYVKSHISKLPIILQSSEDSNSALAKELEVTFLNKNSDRLIKDLKHFLNSYLGFGHFVFRDKAGNKIGVAKTLREFENLLQQIPDESLSIHASENQFSLWLMQRGEIQLARTLNPLSLNMFRTLEESRQQLLEIIKKYRKEKKKGKILTFDETSIIDEKNIVAFAPGSLGGKGRGLAFINTLIYNLDFPGLSDKINITTPITVVIGTDEFQHFISKNKLFEKIIDPTIPYQQLREHFAKGNLSMQLLQKLKILIKQINRPVAVRSSSIAEDSITQPFAGIFDTYIIPNSSNKKLLFEHLTQAIKLVFASTFSPKARNYFTIIHHKIEEEKMAIVLQELVGNQYGDYYYPHISGVAQSYNYYPVANMLPEEGFAIAAVGLGTYVVDGWKSYRFSPKYPKVNMYSVRDLLNSTQSQFYALDCRNRDIDFLQDGELAALKLLDIYDAVEHGTLKHCVSVYNKDNDRLEPGDQGYGPFVVNFANILQYDHVPLAETIRELLVTVEEAFGSPVEIEYAVDLDRTKNGLPSFYLLQIKPLISDHIYKPVRIDKLDKSKMLLFTTSCVGNGQISDIYDIIYIDPEKFDKLRTMEMAEEIEALNQQMISYNRKYILVGPGRWGSRDRFVGIPVNWSQISNAKVIVEISLRNFPLDTSLGSHFFHNVTAMNIGYFSVQHTSATDFIRWDMLNNLPLIQETKFYRHVRLRKPLHIFMDGRNKTSAIVITPLEATDQNWLLNKQGIHD